MVCRLQSSSSFSLMRVLIPSPNKKPSGKTNAARPPVLSRCMIKTKNKSAVSRVLKVAGKLVSIPSSSIPPNGGLVTITSTRSLGPQLIRGLAKVLSCRILLGTSMPCKIILVVHSKCGMGFFSMPKILFCKTASSSTVLTAWRRICSIAQDKKPPVPQAGSMTFSANCGLTCCTINSVTARGV